MARPITLARTEFLRHYWEYAAGEHVTVLGPTGSGKTQLQWELLNVTATVRVPAVVLSMKPRDVTTSRWARRMKLRTVRSWPPPRRLPGQAYPRGWVVWPRHSFDIDMDDAAHKRIYRDVLQESYRHGDRIVVVDEILAATDLGLEKIMRAGWTRGRSMGMGLWGGSQKPTHIPTWAYNQAEHLFLFRDPDKRSRDRFDEIGGMDSGQLKVWVNSLRKYQCLYVRRTGPAVCVIDSA